MVGSRSQNISVPEKASNVVSHGLLLCCGIFILLVFKVASFVVFCASQGYAVVSCGAMQEIARLTVYGVVVVSWAVVVACG